MGISYSLSQFALIASQQILTLINGEYNIEFQNDEIEWWTSFRSCLPARLSQRSLLSCKLLIINY